MKIAVIGVGGTGSAAVRFLAQAGHEVTGFERFRLGHDRGSSHGESRIIRYAYADPLYTELMTDVYPLWADLEKEAGETLFVRCGGLYFGPEAHPEMVAVEQALRECGRAYETLDRSMTAARFPAFQLEPTDIAILQSDGGYLRASACVAANVALARHHGATIVEEALVANLAPAASRRVSVRMQDGSEMIFDAAIVTAGPWVGKFLAPLGLPLHVTRQEVVYLGIARNRDWFEPARFPVWIDAETHQYGFPSDGRVPGVKISLHRPGEVWDPDHPHRPVDDRFVQDRAAYAARRFPDLSGEVTHAQVCLYTSTPDEDFIIDQVPGLPNAWIVSACSGHGFKFTVLCGRIAADLATGKGCRYDLERFSLDRFNTNR